MTNYDISFDMDTYDMYLDGGDIAFATEDTILVQRLKAKLQFLYGEWFLDNTLGLPYTQTVFQPGTSETDLYSIFRSQISATDGVESIESLELNYTGNNRSLIVTFSVNDGVSATVEVAA